MANQNNQFTIDNLKDVVAGALSTVLSRVGDGGTRPSSSNDERPRGSSQQVVEEAAVPPLRSPLPTGTNRRYQPTLNVFII